MDRFDDGADIEWRAPAELFAESTDSCDVVGKIAAPCPLGKPPVTESGSAAEGGR
jgi:hypothetical protein